MSKMNFISFFLVTLTLLQKGIGIFRQINFLVKKQRFHEIFVHFSNTQCGNYGNSLSRIFGKNFVKVSVLLKKLLVRENLSSFHTVPQCGNYGNSLTHFWQKFRQSNSFTKEINK